MNRCSAAVVVIRSKSTECTAGGQGRLHFLVGASNDMGGHKAVADALTGISTGPNRSVHSACFTADHHGDITTANVFTADQRDFRCLRHGIRCLDGRNHAAGFDHAEGNALNRRCR